MSSVVSKIVSLLGNIMPMRQPYQHTSEIAGEQDPANQVVMTNTTPLETHIVIGSLLTKREIRSSQFLTRLVNISDSLLNSTCQVSSIRETVHLADNRHIDIRIMKPYLLRRDQNGCITQVHPERVVTKECTPSNSLK